MLRCHFVQDLKNINNSLNETKLNCFLACTEPFGFPYTTSYLHVIMLKLEYAKPGNSYKESTFTLWKHNRI